MLNKIGILNLQGCKHYNYIDEDNIDKIPYKDRNKDIVVWSISRWSYTKYKGTKTFTLTYNYFTKDYTFCEERYKSYDEVVNKALSM